MLKNEEEFNNFMHRVTEVQNIVKKLTSENKQINDIGISEADRYLDDTSETLCETIDDEKIQLKVISNKTVINKVKEENVNENEMSQEAFMKEIERDAKKRYEDKKVRKEKSDTFKSLGNKAFKREEYERALSMFNKAIDLIRDSCVLYTNRALTFMQLRVYDRAMQDCQTALKLNENSLKAWLYMAKISYQIGDPKKSSECIQEAVQRNPTCKKQINNFVNGFWKEDKKC